MESIRVALGERSYPIHIGSGILASADLYRPHLAGGKVAIVTNDVVARHYLAPLKGALLQSGADVVVAEVEDGEQAKSWPNVARLCGILLGAGCGRDTLVVALGGGVVGDLAGFVAAIYQRGIPFVQVPTTLLAQVDSSVGGKTAINHPRGKNMIGAFHQPRAVVADVSALATLPDRELRAGIAEVIKHGAALDAPFFEWLESSIDALVGRDPKALAHAVRRSCELKADIVARDERESGVRAFLNFGHTFGHAIEAGAGYGTWLHGEAVAAGMVMAAELSVREKLIDSQAAARLRRLIERAGLPVRAPGFGPDRLNELMAVDKKAEGGKVRFILLESLGKARLAGGIDPRHVDAAILAATQ